MVWFAGLSLVKFSMPVCICVHCIFSDEVNYSYTSIVGVLLFLGKISAVLGKIFLA